MKVSSSFVDRVTPCNRRKSGERYEDRDDATLLAQLDLFSCGCRILSREYHDGCVGRLIVRHDGTVLIHELLVGQ